MSGHDVLIAALCAAMCLTPLVLAVLLGRPVAHPRLPGSDGKRASGGAPERMPSDSIFRRLS